LTAVAGSRIVRAAIFTCPARIRAFTRERDKGCARECDEAFACEGDGAFARESDEASARESDEAFARESDEAFARECDKLARRAVRTRSTRPPASAAVMVTDSVALSVMVQEMADENEKPLDPQAARIVAKVRWLMMIASLTTFVAVAAVLGVIGYRFFKGGERAPVAPDVSVVLPAGARVLSSAIGDGRFVLTVEINGAIELLSFDLNTLGPVGRTRLAPR